MEDPIKDFADRIFENDGNEQQIILTKEEFTQYLRTAAEQYGEGGQFQREVSLPPLDDEVRDILGRPCFVVARIAQRLHKLGLYEVKTKAEDEQAVALYWMLSLYAKHGADWKKFGDKILNGDTAAS